MLLLRISWLSSFASFLLVCVMWLKYIFPPLRGGSFPQPVSRDRLIAPPKNRDKSRFLREDFKTSETISVALNHHFNPRFDQFRHIFLPLRLLRVAKYATFAFSALQSARRPSIPIESRYALLPYDFFICDSSASCLITNHLCVT